MGWTRKVRLDNHSDAHPLARRGRSIFSVRFWSLSTIFQLYHDVFRMTELSFRKLANQNNALNGYSRPGLR